MSIPIYNFVKQKLMQHGAHKSRDGQITVENSEVFLTFVRLERAIRMKDFRAVQDAVLTVEKHATALGKRHIIVFAYMYLCFSDGSPEKVQEKHL